MGENFAVILETIPPLMDSLQIVWTLSCHYNSNECMVPLMEQIAQQLCERVDQAIDVHKIFKYVWQIFIYLCVCVFVLGFFRLNLLCFLHRDKEVAISMLRDAKQVLNQWNISYFKMCAEIEESGSYSCWEFDLGRLFKRTDYMASVCQDLCNVFQVCFM